MSIASPEERSPDSAERRPRVLVVDDFPVNIVLLRKALESTYEVEDAASGEVALTMCRNSPPDLVLLDIRMPGIDGYEVLRQLRAAPRTHDLPVILVTAESSEAGEVTGLDLGADDYIAKPIVLPVVLARIRNLLIRQNLKREMLRLEREAVHRELAAARASEAAALEKGAQNERLASLGRLVATFAHDIGNPIGNCRVLASTLEHGALQLAEAILARKLLRSELEKFVSDAQQAAGLLSSNLERTSELLGRFKLLAIDAATSQRRVIRLRDWMEQLIYSMSPLLKSQPHQVTVDVDAAIALETVPGALGQVISNLVGNAYMHAFEGRQGGIVAIAAKPRGADSIELLVTDNGSGVAPDVLAHMFDPFFTTKAGQGGTGLGLDIVQNIVHDTLCGTLAVRSTVGEGTRFEIILPLGDVTGAAPSADDHGK